MKKSGLDGFKLQYEDVPNNPKRKLKLPKIKRPHLLKRYFNYLVKVISE